MGEIFGMVQLPSFKLLDGFKCFELFESLGFRSFACNFSDLGRGDLNVPLLQYFLRRFPREVVLLATRFKWRLRSLTKHIYEKMWLA